jgi:hypothetical protein
MALASGTTWESLLNGTVTGLINLQSTYANEGGGFGLETLTSWGGNENITDEIRIPVVTSFRVDGKWTEPGSYSFGSIGENWWNGVATSAPGIALWGIAGHLQDSKVPNGELLFNDSLPMVLDVPTTDSEPLYGGFSLSQASSGSGIVDISKVSSSSILVSPISKPAYVSVATYGPYVTIPLANSNVTSLDDALISAPRQFSLPAGTVLAVVFASNQDFNSTSVSAVQVPVGPPVTVVCASASVVVGARTACKATVSASTTPTGRVNWSTSGSGKFSASLCRLSKGACKVTYTATAVGSVTLTASYAGDKHNAPSVGTFSLTVAKRVSLTTLSCSSSSITAASSKTVECIAHVKGYSPTGTVAWSQSGTGLVTFNSITCTLMKGSCSVMLTGTTRGSVTIIESYSGDPDNVGSSAEHSLTIK